jgi:hypothetical protein
MLAAQSPDEAHLASHLNRDLLAALSDFRTRAPGRAPQNEVKRRAPDTHRAPPHRDSDRIPRNRIPWSTTP